VGRAPAENDFMAFQASQNASRRNVCRKLTSCQKNFVNGKTIAFDRLWGFQPTTWLERRELFQRVPDKKNIVLEKTQSLFSHGHGRNKNIIFPCPQ